MTAMRATFATLVALFMCLSTARPTHAVLIGEYDFNAAPMGGVIADTSPGGSVVNAFNIGTTWLASATDANNVTRNGVQQWVASEQDQIVIPAHADFNNPLEGTIAFWVKTAGTTNAGGGNHSAMLVDRRNGGGTVWTQFPNGTLFKQTNGEIAATGGNINDDLWHHLAFTFDRTANGSQQVFIDGVLQGTATLAGAWSWNNQPIELGRSHDGFWFRYQGLMDTVRIYDTKLTPAQITALANEASGPLPPPPPPGDEFLYNAYAGTLRNNHEGVVGLKFTTSDDPLPITHLGFVDIGGDGLVQDHRVGIWTQDGSTLLAEATITTNDELVNGFRWVELGAPLQLAANTMYLLAGETFNGGDQWYDLNNSNDIVNPMFVSLADESPRYANSAAWPNPPLLGGGNGLYGAPNFARFYVAPIPEPATASLVLVAVGALLRRRRDAGRSRV